MPRASRTLRSRFAAGSDRSAELILCIQHTVCINCRGFQQSLKHERRRLGRIGTRTPLDPQRRVVRVDTRNQWIERYLEFAEPTAVVLSASCEINRGMVTGRSPEFGERPVTTFGWRFARRAIGGQYSTRRLHAVAGGRAVDRSCPSGASLMRPSRCWMYSQSSAIRWRS